MTFPIDAQTEFCKLVSSAAGFILKQEEWTHPLIHFPRGLWPGDTRFTTRFDEKIIFLSLCSNA